MRPHGTCHELEGRRRLAVARFLEGYTAEEVADFLGVQPRSVYRWLACFRQGGESGLQALPMAGRPAKLSPRQTCRVLGWLERDPQEFGFPTPRWTAPRLALVIERDLGVQLHPRYLNAWLRLHGISPQIPSRVARERQPEVIAHWVRHVWPGIKKSP